MTTKISNNVLGVDAVGSENIQDQSITEEKYADESIPSSAFQAGSVDGTAIGDDQVDTQHYVENSVDNDALADDAVDARVIANNAVENDHILSVNGSKLVTASVEGPALAAGLLVPEHFSTGCVSSLAMAAESVITDKLAANAVTYSKMQTGTANSLMMHGASGAVTNLPPGSENSVLSILGGAPVWSSSLVPTGSVMDYFGNGAPSGWVLANGGTIGSSTSGATTMAASQTESLFLHLWNNFSDSICPVIGGRGASATADWAANKPITLPDFRGRGAFGVDDAISPVGRITTALTPSNTSGSPSTVGHVGGAETFTMTADQMPAHKHLMFTVNPSLPTPYLPSSTTNAVVKGSNGGDNSNNVHYSAAYTEPTVALSGTAGGTGGTTQPTNKMSPFILVTKIMKL